MDDGQVKAPFNMAINTLERIGGILKEIKDLDRTPFMSPHEKQPIKIALFKQLFYQASPLLNETIVDQYRKEIIALRGQEARKATSRNGVVKVGNKTIMFSQDIEDKIDNWLIDIQRELQKEKYFMPPKKDPSKAVFDM